MGEHVLEEIAFRLEAIATRVGEHVLYSCTAL